MKNSDGGRCKRRIVKRFLKKQNYHLITSEILEAKKSREIPKK
jgi:hypothetical protein